jgi:hypothetical protein
MPRADDGERSEADEGIGSFCEYIKRIAHLEGYSRRIMVRCQTSKSRRPISPGEDTEEKKRSNAEYVQMYLMSTNRKPIKSPLW